MATAAVISIDSSPPMTHATSSLYFKNNIILNAAPTRSSERIFRSTTSPQSFKLRPFRGNGVESNVETGFVEDGSPSARFRCVGDFKTVRQLTSQRQRRDDETVVNVAESDAASMTMVDTKRIYVQHANSTSKDGPHQREDEHESNTTVNKEQTHSNMPLTKKKPQKKVSQRKSIPVSAEFVLDSDDSQENLSTEVCEQRRAMLNIGPAERCSHRSKSRSKIPAARASAYFDNIAAKIDEHGESADDLPLALRRRRSWTPLADTAPTSAGNLEDTAQVAPARPQGNFADIVGGFKYADDDDDGTQMHTMTGEHGQKRRKVSSKHSKNQKTGKTTAEEGAPLTVVPKVKKAKKKAQTITALATLAYQVQPVETSLQKTIPEALEASSTLAVKVPEIVEPAVTEAVKPAVKKRQRKSASDKPGNEATSAVKPKARKTKAKKVTIAAREPLPTPSQAQGLLTHQTFVFGTSSQLRESESPTTITEMRRALEESEWDIIASSPTDLHAQSYAIVPSAPHGTSLSVGQSSRNLWSVSARDTGGSLLSEQSLANQQHAEHDEQQKQEFDVDAEPSMPTSAFHELSADGQAITTRRGDRPLAVAALTCNDAIDDEMPDQDTILISSDSITPDVDDATLQNDDGDKTTSDTTSQSYSHNHRAALQPLNANLSRREHLGDSLQAKHARQFSTDSPHRSPRKPVEQPPATKRRKKAVTDETPKRTQLSKAQAVQLQQVPNAALASLASPKRRGRPPKKNASREEAASLNIELPDSGIVMLDGSPSKVFAISQTSSRSSWDHVDEISDSETSEQSPANARCSPPTDPAPMLDIVDEDQNIIEEVAALPATRPMKLSDSQWPSILEKLFPKISSTITSFPPSNSLTNPSWHEKILLYDPIVLEDLTAWLNDQGLRVNVRRILPKPRGRKKDTSYDTRLYEDRDEELAHWMVQKWCEHHSICCLWKDGLRGGVRTRY